VSVVAAASLAIDRMVAIACLGQEMTSSFDAGSKTYTEAVVADRAQATEDYCFGTCPDIAVEAAR